MYMITYTDMRRVNARLFLTYLSPTTGGTPHHNEWLVLNQWWVHLDQYQSKYVSGDRPRQCATINGSSTKYCDVSLPGYLLPICKITM